MSLLPPDRAVNLVIWAVAVSALVLWQVVTARTPGLPSLGSLVGVARRRRWARWPLLVGWGWLGWHLFVRTTWW